MKAKLKTIMMLVMVVLLVSLVSADFWVCFKKGEFIDFCNPVIPDRTAGSNNYKLCMSNYNEVENCWSPGNWNLCNAQGGNCVVSGNTTIDSQAPKFNLLKPVEEGLYNKRSILVEFSLDEKADVYYLDLVYGKGRWRRICNDCRPGDPAYSRKRSFKEGENFIMFKAIDVIGNEALLNVSFFIDSRKPRIHRTEPRSGFAGGEFRIQYTEDNLDEIELFYGVDGDIRNESLSGCLSGKKQWCSTTVDLEDFDGQEIKYYFSVKDITGNVKESRPRKLDVDTTWPVVNSITWKVDGTRVEFFVNVTEDNLDIIEYYDHGGRRPRWRRICSRLRDGICKKRLSLREPGGHSIDFQILDDAGHMVSENRVVNIV